MSRFLLLPGSQELGERLTRTAALVWGVIARPRPPASKKVDAASLEVATRLGKPDPIRDVCRAAGIEFQYGKTSSQDGYAGMLQLKHIIMEPNSCPRRCRDSDVYARDTY